MRKWLGGLMLLFGVVFVSESALADGEKPGEGRKKLDPEALFKKLDTNGDGKLTFEEFRKFFDMLPGGDRPGFGKPGAGKLDPEKRQQIIEKIKEKKADGGLKPAPKKDD